MNKKILHVVLPIVALSGLLLLAGFFLSLRWCASRKTLQICEKEVQTEGYTQRGGESLKEVSPHEERQAISELDSERFVTCTAFPKEYVLSPNMKKRIRFPNIEKCVRSPNMKKHIRFPMKKCVRSPNMKKRIRFPSVERCVRSFGISECCISANTLGTNLDAKVGYDWKGNIILVHSTRSLFEKISETVDSQSTRADSQSTKLCSSLCIFGRQMSVGVSDAFPAMSCAWHHKVISMKHCNVECLHVLEPGMVTTKDSPLKEKSLHIRDLGSVLSNILFAIFSRERVLPRTHVLIPLLCADECLTQNNQTHYASIFAAAFKQAVSRLMVGKYHTSLPEILRVKGIEICCESEGMRRAVAENLMWKSAICRGRSCSM